MTSSEPAAGREYVDLSDDVVVMHVAADQMVPCQCGHTLLIHGGSPTNGDAGCWNNRCGCRGFVES